MKREGADLVNIGNPAMAPARNALVYLDQNILGYLADGKFTFSDIEGVDWIYSNEHFAEIRRSGNTSTLRPLKDLKARQLEVNLSQGRFITDNATLHKYSSPYARYRRYLAATADYQSMQALFVPLLARLCGANNYERVQAIPDAMRSEVARILRIGGASPDMLGGEADAVADELQGTVNQHLAERKSLENVRTHLGTSKGRGGSVDSLNPILELWRLIERETPGVSQGEFFGFAPRHLQGYQTWPLYLGIIGCYTVLNIVGYRTDENIAVESAIPGILSDATHVAHGSFCDWLVSEDRRLCDKAKAIYAFKNIRTQVKHLRVEAHR